MSSSQQFIASLFANYKKFRVKNIVNRRFNHQQVADVLTSLHKTRIFRKKVVGYSVEKRPIHLLSIGRGATRIMFWSQMHGDEPTATATILDILAFFADNAFNEWKCNVLENATFYFIPMLNPDGAGRFIRHNAQGIDINRDALRLQSPEAKILHTLKEKIKPHFAFNLHDQERIYGVANTGLPTLLAFLAPAYNSGKSINDHRLQAMQLIAGINNTLQSFIPKQIAKYNDDFEPRAFGDSFMQSGIPTILIESGFTAGDQERQFVRKLNFIAIISAMQHITSKSYISFNADAYWQIPLNRSNFYDVLIRNILFETKEEKIKTDFGIMRNEINQNSAKKYFIDARIIQTGDLSTCFGHQEFNAAGTEYVASMVSKSGPYSLVSLKNAEAFFLLKQHGKWRYTISNGLIYNCTDYFQQ